MNKNVEIKKQLGERGLGVMAFLVLYTRVYISFLLILILLTPPNPSPWPANGIYDSFRTEVYLCLCVCECVLKYSRMCVYLCVWKRRWSSREAIYHWKRARFVLVATTSFWQDQFGTVYPSPLTHTHTQTHTLTRALCEIDGREGWVSII